MRTERLSKEQISRAAEILKNGGLVAIPTETVYGLAANAFDKEAIRKIFLAKGRPMDNPLIVHIANIQMLSKLVADFPQTAKKLSEAFWPGPLTMILPKSEKIPDEVSAGLPTVAIRHPSHPVALELIKVSGLPLAAPSANRSGSPSPTTAQHVLNDLDGRIDAVLDGGPCSVGLESTVIALEGNTPRILRPGGVTAEQISAVIGKIEIDDAVFHQLSSSEKASSPGMKYKHYAPKAKVILVKADREDYIRFVNGRTSDQTAALCFEEDVSGLSVYAVAYGKVGQPEEQAKNLFSALRRFDQLKNVKTVYAHCPDRTGVSMAVYNRLIRAAGFEVLELG